MNGRRKSPTAVGLFPCYFFHTVGITHTKENIRAVRGCFLFGTCYRLVATAAVAALCATTEAAAITAAETAFAARRTITLWASERNGERAPVHLLAIPTVDSCLSFRLGSHLDEAEAA